ncbi:MAG: hypothetical protein WC030_00665 [Candidatus Paceibacterota bacterium]
MGIENLGGTTEEGPMDTFHGVAHALVATFEGIDQFGDALPQSAADRIATLMGKLEKIPGNIHATDI